MLLLLGWLLAAAGLTTWLWNLTLPELFGWKGIAYWQALRLVELDNVVIGGPATLSVSRAFGERAVAAAQSAAL